MAVTTLKFTRQNFGRKNLQYISNYGHMPVVTAKIFVFVVVVVLQAAGDDPWKVPNHFDRFS